MATITINSEDNNDSEWSAANSVAVRDTTVAEENRKTGARRPRPSTETGARARPGSHPARSFPTCCTTSPGKVHLFFHLLSSRHFVFYNIESVVCRRTRTHGQYTILYTCIIIHVMFITIVTHTVIYTIVVLVQSYDGFVFLVRFGGFAWAPVAGTGTSLILTVPV